MGVLPKVPEVICWLNHMEFIKVEFHTDLQEPHLEVDVPAAVAGEAGPLQFHHSLLVFSLDGKPWHERVPVLFDVAHCGAGRRLDFHLWVQHLITNTF